GVAISAMPPAIRSSAPLNLRAGSVNTSLSVRLGASDSGPSFSESSVNPGGGSGAVSSGNPGGGDGGESSAKHGGGSGIREAALGTSSLNPGGGVGNGIPATPTAPTVRRAIRLSRRSGR